MPQTVSRATSFGLGGRSSGRVGSITADATNPYAAYYNPALLAAGEKAQLTLSGYASSADVDTLSSIVLENSAPNFPLQGSLDYPQEDQGLWSLGLSSPISLDALWTHHHGGVGLSFSGPLNSAGQYQSGLASDFYLLHYGNPNRSLRASSGVGLELVRDTLFLGAGLSLFLHAAGNGQTTLSEPSGIQRGRYSMQVTLRASSLFGMYWKTPFFDTSFVFRTPQNPGFHQIMQGEIEALGAQMSIPLMFSSSLAYQPHAIEMDLQRNLTQSLTGSIGVAYLLWSAYEPSFLEVRTPIAPQSGALPTLSQSLSPPRFRNTWNPRASFEAHLLRDTWTVTGGYSFRQTPVKDMSGVSNILDSNTHIFGGSVTYRLAANLILPSPTYWTLFGQYHWLTPSTVKKFDPQSIGSPGYRIRGQAYCYGISFQAEL